MLKAIESNDISAIQQNSNALEQYSNEGMEKLKTFKAYKNDMSLVLATKKVLEFTKKEALELSPSLVSFMMLNQKFQESKKTMDDKLANTRSNEEIDTFNKLVNEVNAAVGNYNRTINKFNTDRTNTINNWNVAGDNFIARYVPID